MHFGLIDFDCYDNPALDLQLVCGCVGQGRLAYLPRIASTWALVDSAAFWDISLSLR